MNGDDVLLPAVIGQALDRVDAERPFHRWTINVRSIPRTSRRYYLSVADISSKPERNNRQIITARIITRKMQNIVNTIINILQSTFSKIEKITSSTFIIGKFIGALLFIILFVLIIYQSLLRTVSVRPIKVPEALEAEGYSPDITAHRLVDQYKLIIKNAHTLRKARNSASADDARMDLQVPELGVSLSSASYYLARLVGIQGPEITGEIVEDGKEIRLRLRIGADDTLFHDVTVNHDAPLDDLLFLGAAEILRSTDPYTLASYYADRDKSRTLALLPECLMRDGRICEPWAANLRGVLYYDDGDYANAIAQYNAAISASPNFSAAHANLARVLIAAANSIVAPPPNIHYYFSNAENIYLDRYRIFLEPNPLLYRQVSLTLRDPFDQFLLGRLYDPADDTTPSKWKDEAEAIMWYQRAIDHGLVAAMYKLANLRKKECIEHKEAGAASQCVQALELYHRAAGFSDMYSMRELGIIYEKGLGPISADLEMSFNWYQKAATLGDPSAALKLGRMYQEGEGTLPSNTSAYMWYAIVKKALAPGELREEASSAIETLDPDMTHEQKSHAQQLADVWHATLAP